MRKSRLTYRIRNFFKTAVYVLLSAIFFFSSVPARALLLSAQLPSTETISTSLKTQQTLIAVASEQFNIDEQDRGEDPEPDRDEEYMFCVSLDQWLPTSSKVYAELPSLSGGLHFIKVPLYIFLHSWKSFL